MKADRKNQRATKLGIAWYRPEQWFLLRSLSTDADELEHTHAEWLACSTKALAELRAMGALAEKVDVDVEELARWCQERGVPLDGKARAEFVSSKMIERRD